MIQKRHVAKHALKDYHWFELQRRHLGYISIQSSVIKMSPSPPPLILVLTVLVIALLLNPENLVLPACVWLFFKLDIFIIKVLIVNKFCFSVAV